MRRLFKWFTLLLGGLAFLLSGFCLVVAIDPYRQISAELGAAACLDTYPPLLVKAVLLAEDPLFLDSSSTETLRRVFQVFSYRSGRKLEGATITGQLVRTSLTSRRYRILNELSVSVAVDTIWSKQQILATYLGKVCLGISANGPIYGFRQAAYFYYGKPLEALAVAELALLAALARGPSYYSPVTNPEHAFDRRAAVLQSLKDSGAISDSQFNQAIKSPLLDQGLSR